MTHAERKKELVFHMCESFSKYEVNGWLMFPKNLKILIHNPQAMTEYRGQGLFLNLKLDPSPVYLKELQRNKHPVPEFL